MITGGIWPRSIPGSPSGGRPRGTGPTVTTPCPAQSNWADNRMLTTNTSSPQGTRGASLAPANRIARAASPMAAVIGEMSATLFRMLNALVATSPATGGIPRRLGISPTMMSRTRPKTNPVTIGRDMNSAAHPRRKKPPRRSPTPAPMARADVRATACPGSPADMSATIDPDRTDTVDTGPTTR